MEPRENTIELNSLPDKIVSQIIESLGEARLKFGITASRYNKLTLKNIFTHSDALSLSYQKKLIQYAAINRISLTNKELILNVIKHPSFNLLDRLYGLIVIAHQENISLEISAEDFRDFIAITKQYCEDENLMPALSLLLQPDQTQLLLSDLTKEESKNYVKYLTQFVYALSDEDIKTYLADNKIRIPEDDWSDYLNVWCTLLKLTSRFDKAIVADIYNSLISRIYRNEISPYLQNQSYAFFKAILNKINDNAIVFAAHVLNSKTQTISNSYTREYDLKMLSLLMPYLDLCDVEIMVMLNSCFENLKESSYTARSIFLEIRILTLLPLLKENDRQKYINKLIAYANDMSLSSLFQCNFAMQILLQLNDIQLNVPLFNCIVNHLKSGQSVHYKAACGLLDKVVKQLTKEQVAVLFPELISKLESESEDNIKMVTSVIMPIVSKLSHDQVQLMLATINLQLDNKEIANDGHIALLKLAVEVIPFLDCENVGKIAAKILMLPQPYHYDDTVRLLSLCVPKLEDAQIVKLKSEALSNVYQTYDNSIFSVVATLSVLSQKLSIDELDCVVKKFVDIFDRSNWDIKVSILKFLNINAERLTNDQNKHIMRSIVNICHKDGFNLNQKARNLMSRMLLLDDTLHCFVASKKPCLLIKYFNEWSRQISDSASLDSHAEEGRAIENIKSEFESNLNFFKKREQDQPLIKLSYTIKP